MTVKSTTARFKLLKNDAGEPTGEVEFYAAKFGNVDLVGDRMIKGAFADTLKAWREKDAPIPVIFSHDWSNPFSIIGEADPSDVVEDDAGLLVKAHLDINDNPTAKQVWTQMAKKRINEASFAYDVVRESGLKKGRDGANDIYQVDLLEVGPTLKGANPETVGVLSAKSRKRGAKDAPVEGSIEASQSAVVAAVQCYFGSMPGADMDDFSVWAYATFSDHMIVNVCDWGDNYSSRYFDFPYEIDDQGEVQLGPPTEVEMQTQVTMAGKSADSDGSKADDSSDSEDRAQSLFDLSDKQHTQIAVGVVFGAADERNGKPKPQSDWSYRGTNPGADLTSAEVDTVVSRVRDAADKFGIDLNSGSDGKSAPAPSSKAGARNSAADQKQVQSIHDSAVALGASCGSDGKSVSSKDSNSPGVPLGVVETPDPADDGIDTHLATDEDDEVRIGVNDDGEELYAPRSVLSQINTRTQAHQDSDDGDNDANVDADEVDVNEQDPDRDKKSVDYSLDLLELEEFSL